MLNPGMTHHRVGLIEGQNMVNVFIRRQWITPLTCLKEATIPERPHTAEQQLGQIAQRDL